MIVEALGESGFRKHEVDRDCQHAAAGIDRANGHRHGPGMGIDRENEGIEQVARRDHCLDLTALSCAARQIPRSRSGAGELRLGCDRVEKWRCGNAHSFAGMERKAKNLNGKAFRFGIFRNRIPMPCPDLRH